VKVLGTSMITKYQAYNSPFWRSAVSSFISISKIGINDLNKSDISEIKVNVIWTELADSVQAFLFNDERSVVSSHVPDIVKRDENIDITLVDLLARDLVACSVKVPLMHSRLIDVLLEGSTLVPNGRELFAQGCFSDLFFLCTQGGKPEDEFSCHMKVAKNVFPILMNRCREVLLKFIIDDKKSGTLPIARSRLVEVSLILQQLKNLELNPEIDEQEEKGPHRGKKRHLLKLFPLLCDCITTRENEMKEQLKEIFHEAAKELGLE